MTWQEAGPQGDRMLVSTALVASLAQAAATASPVAQPIASEIDQGATASTSTSPAVKRPTSPNDGCSTAAPSADSREIVVCAIRPEGYRLNPDVMEAKRALKSGGRPVRRGDVPSGNQCATVGPMGCRGVPTVNLLGVAATAAQISERLAKGQEIKSVFETTPSSSEYQLYLEAKKEREARQAEKAALAAQKAAVAAAADKQPASAKGVDQGSTSKPAD